MKKTLICPRPPRPLARPRPAARGFALLEVLVALLLFSIGILAMVGLQARAISIVGDVEDRSRAALIADQCASAMQLRASSVTMTDGAQELAQTCKNWSVNQAEQGGLPSGTISVTGPASYAVDPSGAPLASVPVDIVVKWNPPARKGVKGAVESQLTTRVTLLVQNT